MSDNLSLFEMYQGSFRDLERTERISPVTVDKIKLIHEMRDSKLSSFAAHSTSSRGRVVPEQECTIRNCYERDLGRIIYSQAFRRLKHKTQVFFNPANDHICSRLEHVIYVSYIASTIGSALNISTTR